MLVVVAGSNGTTSYDVVAVTAVHFLVAVVKVFSIYITEVVPILYIRRHNHYNLLYCRK